MNQPHRAGQGSGVPNRVDQITSETTVGSAKSTVTPAALCPMQWDDLSAPESRVAGETVISGDVDVMIEFGSATIPHDKCQRIRPGAVVPLENEDRDAVDVYVDGRIIAAGEVFVDDDKYCIRISKLVSPPAESPAD